LKKIGLIPRIILGIVVGIVVGLYAPDVVGRIFVTFSSLFGSFLGFVVPLIILAFIAPGIAELGGKAGKLLGITTGIAYLSTIFAGSLAFFVGSYFVPSFVEGVISVPEGAGLTPFIGLEVPPVMGVISALVLAFIIGIGMTWVKSKAIYEVVKEFRTIVEVLIGKVIIPMLPIHIAGVFTGMAAEGTVFTTMGVLFKVFVLIVLLHWAVLLIHYSVSGAIRGVNPFAALKVMVPAYLTALGTMSSAATIPVTLKSVEKLGVKNHVREFVVPLCATIHLSGSTVTIVICSLAAAQMYGFDVLNNFASALPFIAMLGVTMIAAPGVPGGSIMAALGVLQSMLGFNEAALGLMIALYITQDSFGTATNVTGDGSITLIVDKIAESLESKVTQN